MKIGETLAKRYELRSSLGGGGLGEVFVAWDLRTRREVRAKLFDPTRCQPDDLRAYAALLVAAAKVTHPAVWLPRVQIALEDRPPFIVSEALPGEDLAALRARTGPLPWGRAVEIVHTCAEALAALAAATGAAHRALKPGNVWVAADGKVLVLDFGVATLGVQPTRPRGDGTVVEYRAPEQLEGAPGDASSDVFTLGVLLFELATGAAPFSGPSAFKVAHKLLMQPAPRPSELAPGVSLPSQVEALIARALARKPADRFKDAADIAAHLALVRRSPGAIPRTAGPTAAPAPEAPPAAPEPEDDPTTSLSLPVLRSALGKSRAPAGEPPATSAPAADASPPAPGAVKSSPEAPREPPLDTGRAARPRTPVPARLDGPPALEGPVKSASPSPREPPLDTGRPARPGTPARGTQAVSSPQAPLDTGRPARPGTPARGTQAVSSPQPPREPPLDTGRAGKPRTPVPARLDEPVKSASPAPREPPLDTGRAGKPRTPVPARLDEPVKSASPAPREPPLDTSRAARPRTPAHGLPAGPAVSRGTPRAPAPAPASAETTMDLSQVPGFAPTGPAPAERTLDLRQVPHLAPPDQAPAERTLDLRQVPHLAPESTLALPQGSADDERTQALSSFAAHRGAPVEPTEVLPADYRLPISEEDAPTQTRMAHRSPPDDPAQDSLSTPVRGDLADASPDLGASLSHAPPVRPLMTRAQRPWIALNIALGVLILAGILWLVLRG